MVRDQHIPEEQVGDYVGLVVCRKRATTEEMVEHASNLPPVQASGLFFGRAITSYWPWGVWADVYGRRPVILWSISLYGLCTLAFGFNQSLTFAIATRFLTGVVGGCVPASKTMLGEICDDSNQGMVSQPASQKKKLIKKTRL